MIYKKDSLLKNIRQYYVLYLMALPIVAGYILFDYLPMYGIIIAFKDYDILAGYFNSPWVGLRNFSRFLTDPYLLRTVKNTVILGLYSLLWGFWPPIIFALILNEINNIYFKKVMQTISYLPHFISMVVIVGMLTEFFSTTGLVNQFRKSIFGLEAISFFNYPEYFRSLYIGSGIWQGLGWGSIIYLAALAGIDQEVYEAAIIDGANRFQRIWHISIPGIMPTITILLILSTSSIIRVGFEKVYLMQNPAIYETADVISTYVYRMGIISRDFSYTTAVGLLNSIVSFILLITANKISKKFQGSTFW